MKAIIIGATSGIGRSLAISLSKEGYVLGITGRRTELLDSLEKEIKTKCYKLTMDLTRVDETESSFLKLISDMEDIDLIIISSGIGSINKEQPLSDDLQTIAVNITGFTIIANIAYQYFSKKGSGHIAAISSIMSLRGGPFSVYNASKSYISQYMEGLCCRAHKTGKDISITDIRPGFVNTQMAKGDGIFWMASKDEAARQIIKAIKRKKRIVYITKRWKIIALILKYIPFFLYKRI